MSRPIYSSSYFMQGFILRFCVTNNINIRAKIVLFGKKKYQSLIFPLTFWIPAKTVKIQTKGHIKPHFYQGLHRLQRQNTISKYMQGNYYITSRGLSRSSSEIPFWNNLVVESFFFSFSNTRKMPLLQKVKNHMKGRQMRHFIRVGTACANVKSPMNMQGRICIWTKRVNIVLIISLVQKSTSCT